MGLLAPTLGFHGVEALTIAWLPGLQGAGEPGAGPGAQFLLQGRDQVGDQAALGDLDRLHPLGA
jgi:hypothetical protein